MKYLSIKVFIVITYILTLLVKMAEEDIYILSTTGYSEYTNTGKGSVWCCWIGIVLCIILLALIGWGFYAIIEAFTPNYN